MNRSERINVIPTNKAEQLTQRVSKHARSLVRGNLA